MSTYLIDIDQTICTTPGDADYPCSVPIRENIERANALYDSGHTVIYWTARGTVTGKDWSELTERQLDEWGVKRHELRMGKPHYDVLICDKAWNTFDEGAPW